MISGLFVLVAHAADFQIVPGIPGPLNPSSSGGILAFIQNAYLFALGIAGLLAVASIAWGGIQYTVSRGNPSQLSDAWDRIVQAFVGVLLLVGAGTILSVVNPGLTSLELPDLQNVESTPFDAVNFAIQNGEVNESAPANPPTTSPGGKNTIITPTSSCDKDPSKCKSIKGMFGSCAAADKCTRAAGAGDRCKTHENIVNSLTCASGKIAGMSPKNIFFSTGYPRSCYTHADPGHVNGCSADIVLSPSIATSCEAVRKFVEQIYACGGAALNEYNYYKPASGNKVDFRGCGTATAHANGGNHIHVYGCPRGTQ